MKVRFIQHDEWAGPGEYLAWAKRRGYETVISECRRGPVPAAPDADLLVLLGGWQCPATTKEECAYFDAAAERALIRAYAGSGRPVVGVCLGAQLIGEAFGAPYEKSPEREVGHVRARLTAAGRADPLFSAFPDEFFTGEWHDDMPGLTADCAVIAESDGCPRQIVRYGRLVYGFQTHMEFSRATVAAGLELDAARLARGGRYVRPPEEILSFDYSEMNGLLSSFLDGLVREYVL